MNKFLNIITFIWSAFCTKVQKVESTQAKLKNNEKSYVIASFRNFAKKPIKQIKYSVASYKLLMCLFSKPRKIIDSVTKYEADSIEGKYIVSFK
ncbi:MAG: hypothetical protein DSY77_08175 [Bacteroidetes bacterium]|jgi:hypothetical protein|nr:MAG: hypothetical protein DSY77_08175 [Bacteroidota bacterium]|tara:strand:+ start:1145 stop:1426 length:282 start_codon:yes stop_codon:yes gene_type:complete